MNHLYVCSFSNGLIKVGRSKNVARRTASHVSTASLIGCELVGHRAFECVGDASIAERKLIDFAAGRAIESRGKEWFLGVAFDDVCAEAERIAAQPDEKVFPETYGPYAEVRIWLDGMRGNFARIAAEAALSTKTLSRIANEPSYSVNMRTLERLREVKRKTKEHPSPHS